MSYSRPDIRELLSISKEKCEKNIADAVSYMDIDLTNIGRLVSLYHPLEILKMAFWQERKVLSQSKDSFSRVSARMLPFLVQSVISSTYFTGSSHDRNVKKKDWDRLLSVADDMARRLLKFIDNKVVLEYRNGILKEDDLEQYRNSLFSEFFPERKEEERILFERERAYSFIENESEKVRATFDTDPKELSLALYSFAYYSLSAVDKLRDDSANFRKVVEERMRKLRENGDEGTEEEVRNKVMLDPKLYQESLRLQGLRDDFDMFRPEFTSNINKRTLEVLSIAPGTADLKESLIGRGTWISQSYPFLKIGGMYFSFIGKYLLACAERFFSSSMGLCGRMEAACENAVLSFFFKDDDEGVYIFDGNKIDVVLLSSLEEINPLINPELFHLRLDRRRSELSSSPKLGHKLLVIDTESDGNLEKLGDDRFFVSLRYLLSIRDDKMKRREFLSSILGEIRIDADPLYDELLDGDEDEKESVAENDDLYAKDEEEMIMDEDDIFHEEGEDEGDEMPEEDLPSRFEVSDEEIEENRKKYAENQSIISDMRGKEALEDSDRLIETAFDEDEIAGDEDEKEDEIFSDEGQLALFDDDEFEESEKEMVLDEEEKEDSPFEKSEEQLYEEVEDDAELEPIFDTEDEELEYDQLTEDDEYDNQLETSSMEEADKKADENVGSDKVASDSKSEELSSSQDDGSSGESEDDAFIVEENSDEAEAEEIKNREDDELDEIVLEGNEEESSVLDVDDDDNDELVSTQSEMLGEKEEHLEAGNNTDSSDLEFIEEEEEKRNHQVHGQEKPEDEEKGKVFVLSASDVISERKENEEKIVTSGEDSSPTANGTIDVHSPKFSPFIRSILAKLGDERGVFSTFLENEERPVLEYFERIVMERFDKQLLDGKDKMFSVFEYDMSVILSKNKVYDDLRMRELVNNAGAVMYSKGKESWNVLVIHLNRDMSIEYAFIKHFDKDSFSSTDWKIVTVIGEELLRRGK